MSLTTIPAGATITRVYFAVPEHSTIGDEFDDLAAATQHARARRDDLVQRLTSSLEGYASPEQIEATASTQVRIDLRWVIAEPDGTTEDVVVESYPASTWAARA
jgi:hypothetical protein